MEKKTFPLKVNSASRKNILKNVYFKFYKFPRRRKKVKA